MAKTGSKKQGKPKKRPAVVDDANTRRPRRSGIERGVAQEADARLETYEQPAPRDNDDPRTRENIPDSIAPRERDARLND